jgi:histidyl-tRNA synthetase
LTHIGQSDKLVEVLRTVDKLSKAGEDETLQSLAVLCGEINAKKILKFIGAKGSFTETLDRITELSGGSSPESERLVALRDYMLAASGADACAADACDDTRSDPFVLNPSITRGLDYYTGVVFETFLNELPDIGSICSGGRYDNLAGLYSKTQDTISGVGTSIGLDRLLAAMESLGKLPAVNSLPAAIACVNAEKSGEYHALAQKLRQAGIACEVFTDPCGEKNLVKHFILAEKKGIRYVIIPGESSSGVVTLRDLGARQNTELSIDDVISKIKGTSKD